MGTLVGIAVCVGNKRAVATAPSEVEPTGIMTFADPAVQALCAKTWGDGTNITYEQAREVTEIPKNWAKDNTTITSFNEIKYFKNLLYIRERAFTNCSNLVINEISLPNVLLIELSAFANCTALGCELLNLPSCETLGTTVFYNTTIKRVVMPKLKTIADSSRGYGCFQKIPNLESVTLRDIEYIGDYSFSDDKKLVLDSIEYPNLTRIGQAAFANCTLTLNKAILPNCKKIESSAFNGCSSMALTKLELPLCTSIGGSAFNGCKSMALTKLELPLCTSIGGSAFLNCASMNADINLPQLTSIGIRAFHNSGIAKVTSLGSITSLPDGVWTGSVYAGVFYGCTQLKTIILPDSLTSIGTGSFNGCKLLESVTFGSNISKIGNNAFSECPNLNIDELNLPLLSSIGSEAFQNCRIVKITSLGSITSLPDGGFNSTYSYIGVFARNEQLKSASLPNSITVLGNGSFNRCTSLTQINIPEGVTSLRQVCFNRCSALESIELPSTVTAIGPSAFQYCTGLTRVSITADTPPSLGSSAFADCLALTGIYVPDESIEAYKTATNWSAYANKILPLSQYNG